MGDGDFGSMFLVYMRQLLYFGPPQLGATARRLKL